MNKLATCNKSTQKKKKNLTKRCINSLKKAISSPSQVCLGNKGPQGSNLTEELSYEQIHIERSRRLSKRICQEYYLWLWIPIPLSLPPYDYKSKYPTKDERGAKYLWQRVNITMYKEFNEMIILCNSSIYALTLDYFDLVGSPNNKIHFTLLLRFVIRSLVLLKRPVHQLHQKNVKA